MRRGSSIVAGLLACVGGLLLPATVAAASPYRTAVVIDRCVDSGGAHGRGYLELEVRAREIGVSGTNYFVVKSRQEWNSGLGWSTRLTFPKETSRKFPNDSTNYYHVTDRRYDFTRNDAVFNRFVFVVQFWSNSGGLLATQTVRSSGC